MRQCPFTSLEYHIRRPVSRRQKPPPWPVTVSKALLFQPNRADRPLPPPKYRSSGPLSTHPALQNGQPRRVRACRREKYKIRFWPGRVPGQKHFSACKRASRALCGECAAAGRSPLIWREIFSPNECCCTQPGNFSTPAGRCGTGTVTGSACRRRWTNPPGSRGKQAVSNKKVPESGSFPAFWPALALLHLCYSCPGTIDISGGQPI